MVRGVALEDHDEEVSDRNDCDDADIDNQDPPVQLHDGQAQEEDADR